LSILILQGDAEARMLGQGQATLQACFPECEIDFAAAWTTRSDLLRSNGSPPAAWLRTRQLSANDNIHELLERPRDLLLFSVLADAALPILRTPDGDSFVPHRGVVERWTPQQRADVERECSEGELIDPVEAANALEPIIEKMQSRGAAVAICNIFRHTGGQPEHRGGSTTKSLRERIRAANLEVARLSHRTGCFVLDIDRALAHEGGGALQADCWGGTGRAEELALEELVALVLEAVPAVGGGGA
jgi:hypothetical protein